MRTPQEFIDAYIGKAYAETPELGVQCVYGYKVFCNWCGVGQYPTGTGWADGYWNLRWQTPKSYENFEFITDRSALQKGDWLIWSQGSSCPYSHIAMFVDYTSSEYGRIFGQNQASFKGFTIVENKLDILGAFRWKEWSDNMIHIDSGAKFETSFNGQPIIVYGQHKEDKVTLISAKTGGAVTGTDLQLIADIDDNEHIYYGKLNANYFIMSTGTAIGVRCGVNEWSVPRQGAFYYYALRQDGTTEVGMDNNFWYQKGGVQFACSPAIILMHNGQDVWLISPETANSKLGANTQSMLIRTKDRFAFAVCTGKMTPQDCLSWAKTIDGVQDVCLMDSGGSSCMQIGYQVVYSTAEHRRISNAIAFYRDIEVTTDPSQVIISDEPVISEPAIHEPEPVEDPVTAVPEPETPVSVAETDTPVPETEGYLFEMSNKTYDLIKFIANVLIPLAITLYASVADTWMLPYAKEVAGTASAVILFINSLLSYSTVGYNKKHKG